MLSTVGIEVERRRIGNVTARVIGNDGNVVADLTLVRVAFQRIKEIAYRHVRRPGNTGVCAIRIKQLRICVIRSVPAVIPDSIEAAIRCFCERAEPVPLIRKAIVIDSVRRTESQSAVGAADKHHVGGASAGRLHADQHVNIVVGRAAGVVNREEHHSTKPYSINPALEEAATQADGGVSVKTRCLSGDLRIPRAKAAECCSAASTTNKKVTVGIDIKRSVYRRVRKSDGALPRNAAVCGALKRCGGESAVSAIVYLVLEPVPRSVSLINRKPLLIAARASVG
jgi:hypothetical protein